MQRGSTRTRGKAVLDATFHLEGRVLMSTMVRMQDKPPAAEVGTYLPKSHARATIGLARPKLDRISRHPTRHPADPLVAPTKGRWSWLANTYWYVPANNLAAVLYDSEAGVVSPVQDQTVFYIAGYRAGYFWGESVTQLDHSSPTTASVLASVTPQGRVLLTFTRTSSNSSPSITEGFGVMTREYRQWTMENQMFTSPIETLQIGHWAYMVQTRPGIASWNSLPLVDQSVPQFLSE